MQMCYFEWMQIPEMISSMLTLCIYMCAAGQLVMGDATFNHIYNGTDSTGNVTQRLRPETAADAPQEDQEASRGLHDEARARSISPEAGAQDGLDALHNAIVSNTEGSMSLNAAGTPTGNAPLCPRSCSIMLMRVC